MSDDQHPYPKFLQGQAPITAPFARVEFEALDENSYVGTVTYQDGTCIRRALGSDDQLVDWIREKMRKAPPVRGWADEQQLRHAPVATTALPEPGKPPGLGERMLRTVTGR